MEKDQQEHQVEQVRQYRLIFYQPAFFEAHIVLAEGATLERRRMSRKQKAPRP